DNWATGVVVGPDGSHVFVTGHGFYEGGISADFITISYDARTGAQVWVSAWSDPDPNTGAEAHAITVSPDGSELFVTGASGSNDDSDYVTVAYDAATGTERWMARVAGPGQAYHPARATA